MSARGTRHCVETEGLPLSLKCVVHGQARYVVDRNELVVDEGGWLIVNEDQHYSIEIASRTVVETFILWFPRGWAEEVWRSTSTSVEELLASPETTVAGREFFPRYTPNESAVAPRVRELHAAVQSRASTDDVWLEQKLRTLLAAMLDVQGELRTAIARLPAVRAATRDELWRRLNRARDFAHARCETPLTLPDVAQMAAMSPYHFLRAFKAAFGITPHDWIVACRIERAKSLLARTELPITEVCFAVGYEALGSFCTRFHRATGQSPRAWRQSHGAQAAIRNFREVSSSPTLLSCPS